MFESHAATIAISYLNRVTASQCGLTGGAARYNAVTNE
jgi:hypothetical protein